MNAFEKLKINGAYGKPGGAGPYPWYAEATYAATWPWYREMTERAVLEKFRTSPLRVTKDDLEIAQRLIEERIALSSLSKPVLRRMKRLTGNPRVHLLKTWPEPYDAVATGQKHYEIRSDDRNFKVGDHLLLKRWDPKKERYTGKKMQVAVTYKTSGGEWGLPTGLCVLSIQYINPSGMAR